MRENYLWLHRIICIAIGFTK